MYEAEDQKISLFLPLGGFEQQLLYTLAEILDFRDTGASNLRVESSVVAVILLFSLQAHRTELLRTLVESLKSDTV